MDGERRFSNNNAQEVAANNHKLSRIIYLVAENTCCCRSAISASARRELSRGVGKTAARMKQQCVRPRRQTQPAQQPNICAPDWTAHRIVNNKLKIAAGSTRKKT